MPALSAAAYGKSAFRVFTDFIIGLARYNTIYGTFAVLPIFYYLAVHQLADRAGGGPSFPYAIQNVRSYQQEMHFHDVGAGRKEEMALHMILRICVLFHRGEQIPGVMGLSADLAIPVRLVSEICEKLYDGGLLQEITGEEIRFQPAKSIERITVLDVCRQMRRKGDDDWQVPEEVANRRLEALLASRNQRKARYLGAVTMRDLVTGE